MQINVLLSIKPQFAALIFSGEKQFEFRKAIFKKLNVQKVYVYASSPVSLVIGEFEIDKIISSDPESLWKETMYASGICKDYFDEYFEGKEIAHALQVRKATSYETPMSLMEMFNIKHPPQSFRYVD